VSALVRVVARGPTRRRLTAFLAAATLLGLPAGTLRLLCLGSACDVQAEAMASTPFCSLPGDIRRLVGLGSYEGRSPDIMAVTRSAPVSGGDPFRGDASAPFWPSTMLRDSGTVPLVFAGTGVRHGAGVPADTGLDDVSETIAAIIGLRRAHPGVRSGEAVEGVASGDTPRLVLQVVWKGVGSVALERDAQQWPFLRRLMRVGAGTMDAIAGSLPLDPAATIATIGTGGLPRQHGITGTLLRNEGGALVRAWGRAAPPSVIATLGDDLDQRRRQHPLIGLVGTEVGDRGLIGGSWYLNGDRDPVVIIGRGASVTDQVAAARALLRQKGFGRDDVTDLAGVVLSGPVSELDAGLARLIETAEHTSRGSVAIVVTATGENDVSGTEVIGASVLRQRLEQAIPASEQVIEAMVPGGIFLDQQALARLEVSDDAVVRELLRLRDESGEPLMEDAFPAIAITFGRYC
jgi:hypothetical protein